MNTDKPETRDVKYVRVSRELVLTILCQTLGVPKDAYADICIKDEDGDAPVLDYIEFTYEVPT